MLVKLLVVLAEGVGRLNQLGFVDALEDFGWWRNRRSLVVKLWVVGLAVVR